MGISQLKNKILMCYIMFYGEEEGRYQFSMWRPVTDISLLTLAHERAKQMIREI